jgi:AcrR family transcriptional regulator
LTQKQEESEDLRVQRTRKLILDAFIALTVEKGFAAVTVRDITERAMINRSTFYRHYLDKYDLLEQYMDGVYALTGEEPDGDRSAQPDGQEAQEGPVKLLRHVQEHADFYRVMLGSKGDPGFSERFRQNTERRFRTWVQGSADPNVPPLDLRISCVSYAGVGAIRWWLEHSQQTSPEQLASWLSQLVIGIMGPIVKPK